MSSRRRNVKVEIEPAEALVIGPEDRLLLRFTQDLDREVIEGLSETLREVGLGERTLVLLGDVEMGKVE